MRRRFLPYLSTLSIVFLLALSIIYIPSAISQDKKRIILDSLDELYDYVSDPSELPNRAFEPPENNGSIAGRRRALSNKVNAVIHQIESGAYEGAIGKLTNDIKEKAEKWLHMPWEGELQRKVQHIIDLIMGIAPGFSIRAFPDYLTIEQNSSDTSIINITSWNNFNDPVNLTATLSPAVAEISTTLVPPQVTPPPNGSITSTLTVEVASDAEPDDYEITVTGTSDGLKESVEISLEVTAPPPIPPLPDFSIFVFPTNLTIQQGSSDDSLIIITSLEGFDQPVDLDISSEPIAGVTTVLDPSQVTPLPGEPATSTLTVEVAETAVPDIYTITVTGMSDTLQDSTNLTLTVTTAPSPKDLEDPEVRIEEPANQSYLAGQVNIVVFMHDENFKEANLTIDHMLLESWTSENVPTGAHSVLWDTATSEYPDALYTITLKAEDIAGNIGEVTVTVTVDNTLPTANIDAPVDGSYLRGSVLVRVTGDDVNFYTMNLKIDDESVKNWTTGGSQIYEWNTELYLDGSHNITLTVYDKAGNSEEISITIFVDNAEPTIEAPTWKPREPSVDTQVNVTVKVSDSQPSSGIQDVMLGYRNTTMEDWQPISMSLNVTSGNWTATIPAQSMETTIRFYIVAFDNAGNRAVTDEFYEYKVIAPAGIPLAWIVAIILLILAATAAAVYFWRRRRKKQGIGSSRGKNYKLTILLCF